MKRLSAILMSVLLLFSLFCGCSAQKEAGYNTSAAIGNTTETEEKKLSVVCSIFPQYDFSSISMVGKISQYDEDGATYTFIDVRHFAV